MSAAGRDLFVDRDDGVREILSAEGYQRTFPEAVVALCGQCRRIWDDSHVSGSTPAPAGRCPFEYEH